MEEQDRRIAILFYDYLCKVIGTEDVVRTRRRIYNAGDSMIHNDKFQVVSSGSRAEGLDMRGSDVDIMLVSTKLQVYDCMEGVDRKSDVVAVINETDTKPGFTRLKLISMSSKPVLITFGGEIHNNIQYLSSKWLREAFVIHNPKSEMIVHGPCVSFANNSVDVAYSLQCKKWIPAAQEWLCRSRRNWPTNEVIRSATQYGVLFVPIGHKGSKYEHLEFRISFSITERMLIHSFNHTQLLCYALLKILLKDILQKTHEEALCSYFLKTIMFWICEERETSDWKPERLSWCFMKCFERLFYCVQHKTCLNYFIPENDMFSTRFDTVQHRELLDTLRTLHMLGWEMLLQTETLQKFSRVFQSGPCCFQSICSALPPLILKDKCSIVTSNQTIRKLKICMSLNDTLTRVLSFMQLNNAIVHETYLSDKSDNKHFYKQFKKCVCHCAMGTQPDAVSGWLLLASLFCCYRQYNNSLFISNYCFEQCTSDKILIHENMDEGSLHYFNETFEILNKMKKTENFQTACKLCTVNTFAVFGNSVCLLPKVLHGIIDNKTSYVSPPTIFASTLKYICYHNLQEEAQKRNVVSEMAEIIRNMHLIPRESPLHTLSWLRYSNELLESAVNEMMKAMMNG